MMSARVVFSFLGVWLTALALSMCDARAGTILVFGQTDTNVEQFTATRSGSTTSLSAVNIPVSITDLDGSATSIPAYFDLSATNVTAAFVIFGDVLEKFQGTFSIYSGPGLTATNYLSGSFSDTVLASGTSASLDASTVGGSLGLSFTSGVLTALEPPRGMSLSFTDVSSGSSVADGTLNSFKSNVAGNFSGAVPEPSSVIMLGAGVGVFGIVSSRRRTRRIV